MIELQNVSKVFNTGKNQVQALSEINLKIPETGFTLIKGKSGCGKSTLLNIMGGLLHPTQGQVLFDKTDLYQIGEKQRRQLTAKTIGFIFQSYHLLPYLTVEQNIQIQKKLPFLAIDYEFTKILIDKLQIKDRLQHKPAALSVGEKQRVALVRALASHPKIVLADEPTGNLDPENSAIVLSFLTEFRNQGGAVVMVSHSAEADEYADSLIHLQNGKILPNAYL